MIRKREKFIGLILLIIGLLLPPRSHEIFNKLKIRCAAGVIGGLLKMKSFGNWLNATDLITGTQLLINYKEDQVRYCWKKIFSSFFFPKLVEYYSVLLPFNRDSWLNDFVGATLNYSEIARTYNFFRDRRSWYLGWIWLE